MSLVKAPFSSASEFIICSLEEIVFGGSNSGSFRSAAKFKTSERSKRKDGKSED